MSNYFHKESSKMFFNQLAHDSKNIYQQLKKLPINLQNKARRELRNRNELRSKPRKARNSKFNFEKQEHDALVHATEMELQQILKNTEILSDIPFDVTPEELLGEVAIAKGDATTIYVQREGLSMLTVVLPQKNPTIANLKRAIEANARAQLKREQRERYEERLKRRQSENAKLLLIDNDDVVNVQNNDRQPVSANNKNNNTNSSSCKSNSKCETKVEPLRSTGELVCSVARNGHAHRSNVSWRFLWRAYALYNLDTKQPINDADGRKLLCELGIENAATLKFNQREKYFGRKRQK